MIRHNSITVRYDKFRGESLQEILMNIRKKYGQNVYILDTKEIQDRGIFGTKLLSKKFYEVHIMIPEDHSPYSNYSTSKSFLNYQLRQKKSYDKISTQDNTYDYLLKKESESDTKEKQSDIKSEEIKQDKHLSDFQDIDNLIQSLQKIRNEQFSTNSEPSTEIQKVIPEPREFQTFKIEKPTKEELKILLNDEGELEQKIFTKEKEIREELNDVDIQLLKIREKLLHSEFSEEFTNKFFQVLKRKLSNKIEKNPKEFYSFLIREISNFVYYDPEIKKEEKTKVVFFVGPNGSGKTTSLAKLSAKFKLEKKNSISIISLDDYRLAATEQLKTYSQILDVPFYSPLQISEFKEFLYRDNADFIFIDTPGLSLNDKERLLKIKKFIDVVEIKEIHLVLSSLMRYDVIEKFIDFFNSINFDKIILTGLDEIKFSGFFIELADKIKKPYSFLMNGQNVPEDIMEITVEDLVEQAISLNIKR